MIGELGQAAQPGRPHAAEGHVELPGRRLVAGALQVDAAQEARAAPVQIALGDAHGLNTLKYQPAKIAAIMTIRITGLPILAPLGASLISCASLLNTGCWWLAFFMPDAYRHRVLGIEPEANAAEGAA